MQFHKTMKILYAIKSNDMQQHWLINKLNLHLRFNVYCSLIFFSLDLFKSLFCKMQYDSHRKITNWDTLEKTHYQ